MRILHKHFTYLSRVKYIIAPILVLLGITFAFVENQKFISVRDEECLLPQKAVAQLFRDGEYEDYLEFTKGQIKDKKLKWDEFQKIQELGKKVAQDLCKIDSTIPLILQLAETSEIFKKIKDSSVIENDEDAFQAAFFAYLCKICENSSDHFTSEEYRDLMRRYKSLLLMKDRSANEAFGIYQKGIAKILDLDLGSRLDQHLLKIALEKHIYTASEINEIKADLLTLPVNVFYKVIHDVCVVDSHPESPECRRVLK